MRILTISTSERTGGGAIAASRLNDALCRNGMKARMLVRDKQTDAVTVAQTGNLLPKIAERLDVLMHNGFRRKSMWQVDTACCGVDILGTREYQEADVVHLHWVNQGMLSLSTLERMVQDGKPLVWTLHDEWPFLGVCHYRGACQETECRRCPLMRGSLPHRILWRKRELLQRADVTLVGCSQWITDRAMKALPGVRVQHINNCIPHALYHPIPQQEARRQWHLPMQAHIVLFCSQKVTDERKGMSYLLEAISQVESRNLHMVVVGSGAQQIASRCPGIPFTALGSVSPEQMPSVYAAADVFVTPSLEDNLPNTIAESMSVGTPCAGFRTGGIPEMISHGETGYVAEQRDAADLARGIDYVITHSMREAASRKAAHDYNEGRIAEQYIKIYESR
ncbi:MAG: glycosyltransferase [Bacteroidaceae bacterium]